MYTRIFAAIAGIFGIISSTSFIAIVMMTALVSGCATTSPVQQNVRPLELMEKHQLTVLTFGTLINKDRAKIVEMIADEQKEMMEQHAATEAAESSRNFGDEALKGTVAIEASRPLINKAGEALISNTGMGTGMAAITLTFGADLLLGAIGTGSSGDHVGEINLPAVVTLDGVERSITSDEDANAFVKEYVDTQMKMALTAVGAKGTCRDKCGVNAEIVNEAYQFAYDVVWSDGRKYTLYTRFRPVSAEYAAKRKGPIANLQALAHGFRTSYSSADPTKLYRYGSFGVGLANPDNTINLDSESEKTRQEIARLVSGQDGYLVIGNRSYGRRHLAFKQKLYRIASDGTVDAQYLAD